MMGRALNDGEKALMQNMVNEGYDCSLNVAQRSCMTTDEIKKIAEGRVWNRCQSQRTGLGRRTGRAGQSIENLIQKPDWMLTP